MANESSFIIGCIVIFLFGLAVALLGALLIKMFRRSWVKPYFITVMFADILFILAGMIGKYH